MGKVKWDISESAWVVENGVFIEGATLNPNVGGLFEQSTGNFKTVNISETYDALESLTFSINAEGERWWTDPNNQTFGTEKTGGSGGWGIYKQTNIYTTARKYAGKNNLYAVHIFRYPNISSTSTWGGLSLYPPESACAIRGHKYRFSFDYRGYTNGNSIQVYQNYTVGWGDLGIGLPTAWASYAGSYNSWDWAHYSKEFEIQDSLLDWVPGSNRPAWDPNTQYGTGWYAVTYDGYVYRHHPNNANPTLGVSPDLEYPSIWDYRAPMTAGYFSIYNNLKIGFGYETQGTRGTHLFIDNIQLTDITTNTRWKYGPSGWEADNLIEETTYIKATGTAAVTIDSGNGTDVFAVEGNRELYINDTLIYSSAGRGLRLTIIDENTSSVLSDTTYDTYGVDADRTNLANALAGIPDDNLWVLTSYDAINPNTTLDNQMRSMGSVMLVNDGGLYSVYTGGGVRHPYAAVGRGQTLIKEDGANANDNVYKRKGVIDLRV